MSSTKELDELAEKHNISTAGTDCDRALALDEWLGNRGIEVCREFEGFQEIPFYLIKDIDSGETIEDSISPLGEAYISAIYYAEKNRLL